MTRERGGDETLRYINLQKHSHWYHHCQTCKSDRGRKIREARMCFEGHWFQSSHWMKKKKSPGKEGGRLTE